MKTLLLSSRRESTINNFVDRPSILNFKPLRFLLLFVLFSMVAQVGFGATATWTGGTGTGKDWTLASNWGGTAPAAGDDIVFNTAGTITFSAMPVAVLPATSIAYNSITVSQGTVTIAGAAPAITLILGGNVGTDFSVASGASFIIGANTNITLANPATATIAGTLNINNTGSTYDTGTNANVLTTISSGTGILTNGGTVTSTLSKLVFQANTVYNHTRNGGSIPLSNSWAVSSTVNVTGITNTALSNFNQLFGTVNWNCASQTVTQSTASGFNPAGNFSINNTGTTGSITLANAVTSTISGTMTVASGTTLIAQATSVISGTGNFTLSIGSNWKCSNNYKKFFNGSKLYL
jgi:hypothetical protein